MTFVSRRLTYCSDVELELDLLAHEDAALVERDVEVQAPVAAVDRRLALEAGPEVAPRVIGGAGQLEVDGDGIGLAVDREVADQGVDVVVRLLDLGRGELDGRVDLDVEEVGAAQVRVTVLVARVHAVRVDRQMDAAVRRVLLVEVHLAAVHLELATDVDDHGVLRREAQAAVGGVDLVVAGQGDRGVVGLDLADVIGGGHGLLRSYVCLCNCCDGQYHQEV